MNDKRLRRSAGNKIIGGLCGGLGDYFNIDPTIIRLIWVVATFWMGFTSVIAYFIGLIVVSITEDKNVPAADSQPVREEKAENPEAGARIPSRFNMIWGWLIIGVGVIMLLQTLGFFSRFKEYFFPGILIIAGVWVLIRGMKRRF
ncbi:MAG TPA: hypothetical protein DDW50_19405 [Firmicutes bacterium]|jgi:phage shock protein C|nr:hypothetical protein [Bacillota bacterium]